MMKNTIKSFWAIAAALLLLLPSCQKHSPAQIDLQGISHNVIPMDSDARVTSDADFARYCDSLKKMHDSPEYMGKVLCADFQGLPYHYTRQNVLTDYLTDILYQVGDSVLMAHHQQHADIAILNYGGIRTGIEPGAFTRGNLYDVLCFDNYVVMSQISGAELQKALVRFKITEDNSKENKDQPCSHLQMTYLRSTKDAEGYLSPDANAILINGQKLDPQKLYWVVSINFLLDESKNGDHIFEGIVRKPMERVEPLLLLRDAVEQQICRNPNFKAVPQARVLIK